MTKNKSGKVAKLDSLVSKIVLSIYGGKCLFCGCQATDTHHWYRTKGAGGKRLRWNLINLFPLCRKCHTAMHSGGKKPNKYKAEIYLSHIYAKGPLKLTEADLDRMISTARKVLSVCEDEGCAEGIRKTYVEAIQPLDFLVEGL